VRPHNAKTFFELSKTRLPIQDIKYVLNQGGYYLRQLPLHFDQHACQLFKEEMPSLLGAFLRKRFCVDLPWLKTIELDDSLVDSHVCKISADIPVNILPGVVLNPFNINGVPLHCVAVDCRYSRAVVLDSANVTEYAFTLDNLHALCDGRWTPSFRRIWCVCCR
jgi:hypothetical protein